jgi:hypothetical protein
MRHSSLGFLAIAATLVARGARADEDRGYLGAMLGPAPDPQKGGALVEEVAPGSPAEKAGLARHDVITAVGGEALKGPEDMKKLVRSRKPGDKIRLTLQRGSETLEVEPVLGSLAAAVGTPKKGDRPAEAEKPARESDDPAAKPAEKSAEKPAEPDGKHGFFGVGFGDVPAILAEHLGLAEGTGVVIEDVWADSPAKKAGLDKGDVLVAFDGYEIKGTSDFARLVSEKKVGDKVKVDFVHKGAKSSVEVVLAERPAELSRVPDDPFFLHPGVPGRPGPFRVQPFHGPGFSRKGRIIVEGPQGRSWQFEIPDGVWKAEELSKDIGAKMKDLEKDLEREFGKIQHLVDPEELAQRLRKLTEELDDLKQDGSGGSSATSESRSSVVRMIEDGYDISVQDQNGIRTVTVKKGDQSLAENLPWDKLGTLPEDVRVRVEKVAQNHQSVTVPRVPKELKELKERKVKA